MQRGAQATRQSTHGRLLVSDEHRNPAGQVMHETAPVKAENVPATHAVGVTVPVPGQALPMGHGAHARLV